MAYQSRVGSASRWSAAATRHAPRQPKDKPPADRSSLSSERDLPHTYIHTYIHTYTCYHIIYRYVRICCISKHVYICIVCMYVCMYCMYVWVYVSYGVPQLWLPQFVVGACSSRRRRNPNCMV